MSVGSVLIFGVVFLLVFVEYVVPFLIKRGDRIAQMVISKVHRANILETKDLGETPRGEGGFGHSGIK